MPPKSSRSNLREKKRKTRKRAVLQFRIPEAEYRELARTAAKSDLTISEEAARRLLAYSAMEQKPEMKKDAVRIALLLYNQLLTSSVALGLPPPLLQIEEILVKVAMMGAE